jgi:hypothetical protein
VDGLSWGVNPTYTHEWNGAESEIKLQISRRETPTLAPESKAQCEQSYFRHLPFVPAEIKCLALPEILAEKIRACYQRNKARDIYDLGIYATRPIEQPLIRRLVVLKLWQARDTFYPERLINKFEHGTEFDWDDLRDLVRRDARIDRERICADCVRGFRWLELLDRMNPTIEELTASVEQEANKCPEALRLMTHPGVGPLTALAYVLIIGTPTRFACAKQIGSYAGLIPSEDSSGGKQRLGHISKQGNSLLRFLLVEAAQAAVRCNPDWRRRYRNLAMRRQRNIAKVAMGRRLGVCLYWMWRRGWEYPQLIKFGSHAGELGTGDGVR